MSDPVPVDVNSFSYDTTRCRSPIRSVPLPAEFFPFIGQVVVLWSAIETLVDEMVQAMCSATQTPPEAVDKRFTKRAKQFKDLARDVFNQMPSTKAYLEDIADEGIVLHRERNLIAHGRLSLTNDRGFVGLLAKGYVQRKDLEKVYSLTDLEDLFFALSHLAGRLTALQMCALTTTLLEGRIVEAEVPSLQKFCRDHYPGVGI